MKHDHDDAVPSGLRDGGSHASTRTFLRATGAILLVVGGLFALVGLIDFFGAFGTFRAPTKFWCLFVGLPCVFFGVSLLKAGFLGTAARYVANETVPVARDSAVEVAEGLRPTIKGIAEDLRGSPRKPSEATSAETRLRALEKLRADGLVSEAEYAEQRTRILREL